MGKPGKPKKQIRKVCANTECGKTFITGGRAGKADKQYCDRVCAGVGRIRHPAPRLLTETEAARLAGFFDGEGSIIRAKPNGWRMTIYQSHEGMIRWIADVTGTGHVTSHMPNGRNLVNKPVPKEQWYWNLYGRNAAALLKQLLPYLLVKRKKAEELIGYYE